MTKRTKPIILTTAHTGARNSPWEKTPEGRPKNIKPNDLAQHMPITVEEAIQDAMDAYDAGSRLIHFHARNPETGVQYADAGWYKKVAHGIREHCPDALISFPTSRKGEVGKEIDRKLALLPQPLSYEADVERRAHMEFEIRASALDARPDTITSLTVPENTMFPDTEIHRTEQGEPGWNKPPVMQAYYKKVNRRANELGIGQEIEITTMKQFEVLDKVAAQKDEFGLKGPLHVVLLLGFSGALPINRQTYDTALKKIDDFRRKTGFDVTVTCGAVIRPEEAKTNTRDNDPKKHDYEEVMKWVTEDDRVDAFRVGLEDTPKLYGEQQTNSGLVYQARAYFERQGVRAEENAERIRKTFRLPERKLQKVASMADSDEFMLPAYEDDILSVAADSEELIFDDRDMYPKRTLDSNRFGAPSRYNSDSDSEFELKLDPLPNSPFDSDSDISLEELLGSDLPSRMDLPKTSPAVPGKKAAPAANNTPPQAAPPPPRRLSRTAKVLLSLAAGAGLFIGGRFMGQQEGRQEGAQNAHQLTIKGQSPGLRPLTAKEEAEVVDELIHSPEARDRLKNFAAQVESLRDGASKKARAAYDDLDWRARTQESKEAAKSQEKK